MNKPQNPGEITEWIDRYISGKMNSIERDHFEAALLKDYHLALQLEEQIQAREMLDKLFMEERLRDQIKTMQRKDRRIQVFQRMGRYVAAASILVICALTILVNSNPVFPDSENDFTVIRSADESVIQPERRLVFDHFFAGQAHLAEGEYALAVRNFENVLEEEDLRPYFREAAQWHLAIAYLKSGNIKKADSIYTQFKNCESCVYHVSGLNRFKIWLQINYARSKS